MAAKKLAAANASLKAELAALAARAAALEAIAAPELARLAAARAATEAAAAEEARRELFLSALIVTGARNSLRPSISRASWATPRLARSC